MVTIEEMGRNVPPVAPVISTNLLEEVFVGAPPVVDAVLVRCVVEEVAYASELRFDEPDGPICELRL